LVDTLYLKKSLELHSKIAGLLTEELKKEKRESPKDWRVGDELSSSMEMLTRLEKLYSKGNWYVDAECSQLASATEKANEGAAKEACRVELLGAIQGSLTSVE